MVLRKVATSLYRNDASGSYFAVFKANGKNFKRKLKSTSLAQAKIEVNRLKVKIGKRPDRGAQITLIQLAERYRPSLTSKAQSTQDRDEAILRKLEAWEHGGTKIDEIAG